ncbi:MAG: hypothetical protein LBD13_02595 [Spirochaetaceae bacterium]|jgi:hypothetical protein|nr:hypothetical protein [Spirochaetaceae bacterium]
MTVWDILDKIISASPPILAITLCAAGGIVFVIGFSRHGMDFVKHGFKQTALDSSLLSIERRFDTFEAKFDTRFGEMDNKMNARFADMDNKINVRFAEMDNKIAALDNKMNVRFVEMDNKMDVRFVEMDNKMNARFVEMDNKIAGMDTKMDGFSAELAAIKSNHFGHLKNYLGILNGVLLDKQIIDNETRARLDNELRDM